MAKASFSLKDQLFNRGKVAALSARFAAADPGFDAPGFTGAVMAKLPELELKQRITWIADVLAGHLPGEFARAAGIIEAALPPPLDPGLCDNDFGDFIHAPLGDYVARFGQDEPEMALDLLHAITQRFSMEWAIRPFITGHPDLACDRLRAWCGDPNYHVRRLVSEGTRPRLPWAPRIVMDAGLRADLLDRLHADPTRYVTRSVANHLGDVAKTDLDAVLAQLARWRAGGRQAEAELAWMERHALRGPVKAGHAAALGFLGYAPDPPVSVTLALSRNSVAIGGAVELTVQITAQAACRVIVDYVIDFVKASGRTAPKVFKLRELSLEPGMPVVLTKLHRFKGDATTFRLYPGATRVRAQINGQPGPAETLALRAAG